MVLVIVVTSQISFAQPQDTIRIETNRQEFRGGNDTTHLIRKGIDPVEIQKLKSDPGLNYQEAPTVAESLWDRFRSWIGQLLNALFEKATMTDVGRVLMYAIGIVALIIIVMALIRVNAFRVFYGNPDQGKFNHGGIQENIHEMDFEKLIQEAVERNDFRLATRLIFLYALKLLADKSMIHWQAGKTNHDYVNELKTGELKTGLSELSFYFDYAWYGHFAISHQQYQRVNGLFESWRVGVTKS